MRRRRLHRTFLELAAFRLAEPLDPADERRLGAHLATCDACRGWVAGYEADRAALRGLREPPPPRDLWTRTAAALDREEARLSGWRPGAPMGRRRARGAFAAALSFLVVLAVVGSGVIPGIPRPFGPPTAAPRATPFAVEPGVFAYVSTRDGEVGVYVGRVDRVCPESAASGCLPLDSDVRKVTSFTGDFVPQQLSVSPDGRTAAVVGTSPRGGAVYAIRLPEAAVATPLPLTTASPEATATAVGTVGPTSSATPSAETTAGPEISPTPETTPSAEASPSPEISPTPEISLSPEISPGQEASPSGEPSPSFEPTAIIENVVVEGETPAYSPDGSMLAFSARPEDGSAGPDIYLWRVGSDAAVPLTSDHASFFASWGGGAIVGSRAGAPAGEAGESVLPESFLLDPLTLETRALARSAWRPIVDPTGRFVIYWDGTLVPDGATWREEAGGLYLARWEQFNPSAVEATPEPGATPQSTEPAAEPSSEPTVEGSPAPASPSGDLEPQQLDPERDYLRDPILAWEVRWSPDGEWFGAWIGDRAPRSASPGGPEPGSLTVAAVDRTTGRIDRSRVELDRAPAVRGFALGDDRIAWATLPGPGGTSQVRLLVWSERGRGVLRTEAGGGNDTLPAL